MSAVEGASLGAVGGLVEGASLGAVEGALLGAVEGLGLMQVMRSRKDEDHPSHLTGGEAEQPKGVDDA